MDENNSAEKIKRPRGRPAGRGVVLKLTVPAGLHAKLEERANNEFASVKSLVCALLRKEFGDNGEA